MKQEVPVFSTRPTGAVHLVSADQRLCAVLLPLLALLPVQVFCHADVDELQGLPAAGGAECIVCDDTLDWLRALSPGRRVIVLTRNDNVPRAVQIMRAGAVDCLDAYTAGATLLASVAHEMNTGAAQGAAT